MKNEQSILTLLESIISSKEFWNTSGQLTLIKSPLDLFAGTSRTLNTAGRDPISMNYWPFISTIMKGFDQDIFDPQSIDGWPTGKEWLQGNTIDRRSGELKRVFLSEPKVSDNPVNDLLAVASWNSINAKELTKQLKDQFYKSAKSNQILVEDIIVESDNGFRQDKFYQIRLVFKNVHFNDEVYDHISVNLNYCPRCDRDWRNHLQLYKEMVPEFFLSNARFDGSDGDTVHIEFKLPMTTGSVKGIKESDWIIIKNLVRSTSVFFDEAENFRFGASLPPKGGKAKTWLKALLEKSGPLIDVYDPKSPVRLFKPLIMDQEFDRPRYLFNCDIDNGIHEERLSKFFEFKRLMQVHHLTEKSELAKMLTRIWETKPSIHDSDVTTYLMPEFAILGGPASLSDTFSLVEYNLR
jgi:hypothetical protein